MPQMSIIGSGWAFYTGGGDKNNIGQQYNETAMPSSEQHLNSIATVYVRIVKACAFFIFSPNDNPSKTMKNALYFI